MAAAAIDQCETGRKRPLQSHLSHHQHHHLQQHDHHHQHYHPQQRHHHQQHHHHPQQHQCHHCQHVDFVMAVNFGVILSQGNDWELNFLWDIP